MIGVALTLWGLCGDSAFAIITMGGAGRNLTPAPDNLGQYVGTFGDVLGIPIAPRYFVTAAHVGNPGTFQFQNGTSTSTLYHPVSVAVDNDLAVYRIATSDPSFTLFAPLYTVGGEAGRELITLGRGTARGSPFLAADSSLRGWSWGPIDHATSWGRNNVTDTLWTPDHGDLLTFTFDRRLDGGGGLLNPDEAIYSSLDSGGPVFIRDPYDGVWKLAGINFAVDGRFSLTQGGPFTDAALFDARGLWVGDDGDATYLDPSKFTGPLPASSYATRIATRYGFLAQATGFTVVPEPSAACLLVLGLSIVGAGWRLGSRRGRSQR